MNSGASAPKLAAEDDVEAEPRRDRRDLAASIAAAYQGVAAPEVTVFEIVMPLRT